MPTSLHDTADSAPAKSLREQLRAAIAYDDARASAPQEHAVTLLAAVGFALCALRAPGRPAAVCHAMLSGALLYRAASGRDGVRRWAGADPARPPGATTAPDTGPRSTDWRNSGAEASDPQSAAAYTGA